MRKRHVAKDNGGSTDYRSAVASLIREEINQLSPAQFKVAVHLYACMEDEQGPVRSSIAEIAKATGLSCRAVQSCRAHLFHTGIIALNSIARERSEYDLPGTSPPPAEPDQRPLASAANGAPPTPQPTRPSILVDAPAEENARIAWLLERLGGAITQLSMLKQAAGDDQSKLLRALESLAVDGPQGKGSKPGLFAAVVSHRLTVLQRGS